MRILPTRRLPAPGAPPTRRRRSVALALRVCAASSAALVALPVGATPAAAASAASPMVFGAAGTSRSDVEDHERVLGARLNGLRVYKNWDSRLFGPSQTWARDTGHTLYMSVSGKRRNGSTVKWADIARAKPGSALHADMLRQAQQIKAFRAPLYIAFNHEPESHVSWSNGNGADFVAAWRKVISTWRAAGVRNAEYVFTGTAYGFTRKDQRRTELYYPGDAYVDHIAADGYNWYRCRDKNAGWRPLADVIEGHRQFGLKHPTKGLMLWEFGSAEDRANPGRKARWMRDATAMFQGAAYRQYRAVLTWEGRNFRGDGPDCGFDYMSSSSARQAWVDMGRHAAFRGTGVF